MNTTITDPITAMATMATITMMAIITPTSMTIPTAIRMGTGITGITMAMDTTITAQAMARHLPFRLA